MDIPIERLKHPLEWGLKGETERERKKEREINEEIERERKK